MSYQGEHIQKPNRSEYLPLIYEEHSIFTNRHRVTNDWSEEYGERKAQLNPFPQLNLDHHKFHHRTFHGNSKTKPIARQSFVDYLFLQCPACRFTLQPPVSEAGIVSNSGTRTLRKKIVRSLSTDRFWKALPSTADITVRRPTSTGSLRSTFFSTIPLRAAQSPPTLFNLEIPILFWNSTGIPPADTLRSCRRTAVPQLLLLGFKLHHLPAVTEKTSKDGLHKRGGGRPTPTVQGWEGE